MLSKRENAVSVTEETSKRFQCWALSNTYCLETNFAKRRGVLFELKLLLEIDNPTWMKRVKKLDCFARLILFPLKGCLELHPETSKLKTVCIELRLVLVLAYLRTKTNIPSNNQLGSTPENFMTCLIKTITGWWLVECDGEVGWAPALYLEPADEMADASNVQKFPVGRGMIANFPLLCIRAGFKLWLSTAVSCCRDYHVHS